VLCLASQLEEPQLWCAERIVEQQFQQLRRAVDDAVKGTNGKVFANVTTPPGDCFYCHGRWHAGLGSDVEHYLTDGTMEKLRPKSERMLYNRVSSRRLELSSLEEKSP